MKKIAFIILLLCSFSSVAQQQSFEFFAWDEVKHPLYKTNPPAVPMPDESQIPDYSTLSNSTFKHPFKITNGANSIEGLITSRGISIKESDGYKTSIFKSTIGLEMVYFNHGYYAYQKLNLQKDSTFTIICNDLNNQNVYVLSYKNKVLKLEKTYNVITHKINDLFKTAVYVGKEHTYFYCFPVYNAFITQIKDNQVTTIPATNQKCHFYSKGSDLRADENYFWVDNEEFYDEYNNPCKVARLSHDIYFVSGTVFYDANANGWKDSNELTFSDIKLSALPSGLTLIPDNDGRFAFKGEPDKSYQLKVLDSTRFSKITVNNVTYTIGVKLKDEKPSVFTNVWLPASRCNTLRSAWVKLENNGVVAAEKVIVKLAPNDKMKLVQNELEVDTAKFTFTNITARASVQNDFDIRWAVAEEVGKTATLKIITEIYNQNTLVSTNVDSIQTVIRCSYDPNDKSVTPAGEGDSRFTLKNSTLEYLVRFENTGNDTAYQVVIYDTLSNQLDFSSLKVLGYSHKVNTEISTNGIIAFHFNDIMLPDKASSGEKAEGFVRFSLAPKASLDDYTEICNSAAIVFDENKPIITNKTCNMMVEKIPVLTSLVKTSVESNSIYPNPAADHFNLPANTLSYRLYDAHGTQIFIENTDVSNLHSGIYLVRLRFEDDSEETQKLIIKK